ncbi:hypothetical protein B0I35DRAFT_475474 [Stachybotrys elegans]|uniref:Lipocalin-like domain-containing protein n=1 Tax=Stachybotrys elegans TaxID=80388 RepID=A0A8K0SYE6_9HYPO|nr:hypothetical protein B0I35DRAFT_475474 [Stachybotrys elegans]
MAAPADKNNRNLSGTWVLNKTLSDSPEAGLALQGIGFLLRKTIGLASITVTVNQYEAPPKPPSTASDIVTHIDSDQSAAGLSSTKELRCFDNFYREHSDWLFGDCKGRSQWVSLDEIEDEWLRQDWLPEGDGQGKNIIFTYVENASKGWTATQIWGFQMVNGERRHCRRIIVQKDKKREQFRFVYDYVA